MNLNLTFEKWTAAGNDFIFLQKSDLPAGVNPSRLVRRICSRHFSIGADGVLLIDGAGADFWNSDGSPADFCGNAARCFGRYRLEQATKAPQTDQSTGKSSPSKKSIPFKIREISSIASLGPDNTIIVTVPEPEPVDLDIPGNFLDQIDSDLGHSVQDATGVDSGVPHLVLTLKNDSAGKAFFLMEPEQFRQLGILINKESLFAPAGINIDLLLVSSIPLSPLQASLRTWERGVNGETLACGTGALAACFVMNRLSGGGVENEGNSIRIKTRSEAVLQVETAEKIWMLRGPAFRICRGHAELILADETLPC